MEDQYRDLVAHIKDRFRRTREGVEWRAKKALSDRDILGKGLERFWNDFRKTMGELCERLSRELGISLSCKWNGEVLIVTKSNSPFILSATVGSAPPYEVVVMGENGLRYTATVRIILEDSQTDTIAVMDDTPTFASKVAGKALEALLFCAP